MDKNFAIQQIKDTFEGSFNKERFVDFIKNLLNHVDESKAFHARGYVPDAYKNYVKTYERLATYIDPEDSKIDILVVYLQKQTSLERARTAQRNFLARYLKGRNQKDAGLVAFVSPDSEDWRFSLVKMDYSIDASGKKIKVKQELTPARRFSFLVGKNEKSHTAKRQLMPILEDDLNDPTLKQLEEAFNIERVTKEFFEKYRDLFLRLKEELDKFVEKDSAIKKDFIQKDVSTVDFTKKLLGQIVFLYFLQKKGWFGVKRGEEWGSGSKNFLRELFEKKHAEYRNFFNNILEPLFYEALRLPRPKDYYSQFECRIPFLNGGLFDPINDYDWQDTDIELPDKLFSNNEKTKEDDTGTGILDIFDRYNFTVKEDEPLEKEVAIDPEMLGKIFEKLGAITEDKFNELAIAVRSGNKKKENEANKKLGVYYTPREIVHYMCQESLINYLYTELNPGVKITIGTGSEQANLFGRSDPKQTRILWREKKEQVSRQDIETFIKYGDTVIEHEIEVKNRDKETKTYSYKLPRSIRNNTKLIDEKLAAVRICDPACGSGAFLVGMMNEIIRARNVLSPYFRSKKDRTMYNFKRRAIQDCLYGVDIDSGAAEIARLRLWLSLIVDEEDIKQIKPLPNLDYKIVCGNSLLGYPYKPKWIKEIETLKKKFVDANDPKIKQRLKNQVDSKIKNFLAGSEKSVGYKVDFDFKICFSEVFYDEKRKGFDVIVANPPYVDSETMVRFMPELRENISASYITAKGNWDLYVPFWELGFKLLNSKGNVVFITPNKWLAIGYGSKLRELLYWHICRVGNCDQIKVFESGNSPVIIFVNKFLKGADIQIDQFGQDYIIKEKTSIGHNVLHNDNWGFLLSQNIELILKIMKKSQKVSDEHYAENPFTVSEAYDAQELLFDLKISSNFNSSKYFKFVNTGTIERYYSLWALSSTTYLKKKYKAPVIEKKVFEKKFPKRFIQMNNEKIIISGMRHFECILDFNSEIVAGKSTIILKNKNSASLKWILGLLNSRLISFYIKEAFGVLGIDGGINFTSKMIEGLPLPIIGKEKRKNIEIIVDKILKIVQDKDYLKNKIQQKKVEEYKNQIDKIVYKLYDLEDDEIKIVEGG